MKKLRLLILATLMSAGCASNPPVSHVGVFATSAETVADSMVVVLEDVNESAVEQKKASLATKNQTIPEDAFKGTFEGNKDFQIRIEAVNSLKNYSKALSELASANFREDIDKASSDLYGSMSGINSSIALLGGPAALISDASLKAIATAVDAIGARIVEEKRFDALQEIVTSTDDAVQKLVRLIGDDLDGFKTEIKSNADSIYTDATEAYYKESDSLSYAERLERLDELDIMERRVTQAPKVVDQLDVAADQMGVAHAKLTEALEAGKYSTTDLVKEIGRLRQEADRLKKFYASLGSE